MVNYIIIFVKMCIKMCTRSCLGAYYRINGKTVMLGESEFTNRLISESALKTHERRYGQDSPRVNLCKA